MYDYIKIRIDPKHASAIFENPNLNFYREISEKTGESRTHMRAEYRDLKFYIYDNGLILLKGSFHKYFNKSYHNYNDFHLFDFKKTLSTLEDIFELEPDAIKIYTLEVGVNIKPPLNTSKILNNLMIHKGEKFKDCVVKNGNYKQCQHSCYIIKCYDKGRQNKLPYDLLRFEIKFTNMEQLHKKGIFNLSDLLNPEAVQYFGKLLQKKWEEIIFYDPTIDLKMLTMKEMRKTKSWGNSNYWLELVAHTKIKDKNKLNREQALLNEIILKKSSNIRGQLRTLIRDKWNELNDIQSNVKLENKGKIKGSIIPAIIPISKT